MLITPIPHLGRTLPLKDWSMIMMIMTTMMKMKTMMMMTITPPRSDPSIEGLVHVSQEADRLPHCLLFLGGVHLRENQIISTIWLKFLKMDIFPNICHFFSQLQRLFYGIFCTAPPASISFSGQTCPWES